MLSCRACGRLTGDTPIAAKGTLCPEFLAAQPALRSTRGRHATGRGYPMNWYEDAVGDLLKHVSLSADVVARVVEIQRDVAPEPLQNARVERERAAATQRLERDRDTEAHAKAYGWDVAFGPGAVSSSISQSGRGERI